MEEANAKMDIESEDKPEVITSQVEDIPTPKEMSIESSSDGKIKVYRSPYLNRQQLQKQYENLQIKQLELDIQIQQLRAGKYREPTLQEQINTMQQIIKRQHETLDELNK